MMLDRLQYVKQCFDEVSDLIIQPDVIADFNGSTAFNSIHELCKELHAAKLLQK